MSVAYPTLAFRTLCRIFPWYGRSDRTKLHDTLRKYPQTDGQGGWLRGIVDERP
jgi:hypothetical protein